jgi:tetratricopeptide (TPR) repeat protein
MARTDRPAPRGRAGRHAAARAARRLRLARYWLARGDLDEAARHLDRAAALLAPEPAASPGLTADVLLAKARVERDRDRSGAARAHLDAAAELLGRAPHFPGREVLRVRVLAESGDWYRRAARYPQAAAELERAQLLLADCPGGGAGSPAAQVFTARGITAKESGALDEAREWYLRALEALGPDAPPGDTAPVWHNLAGLAHAGGRYVQAEEEARLCLALRRRVAGVSEVDLALDRDVLAAVATARGRHGQARAMIRRSLEVYRAARPPRRYEIAVQTHVLACVEQADGRMERAEHLYREALRMREELMGPHHPETARVANNLGTLLHGLGRRDDAAAVYHRALATAVRADPPHPRLTEVIRANLDRLSAGEAAPDPV